MSSSNAAGRSALLLRFGREAAELTADASPPPYSAFADDDLLVLVQSGDREALGVLFDRYARLVLSVGLRIIRVWSAELGLGDGPLVIYDAGDAQAALRAAATEMDLNLTGWSATELSA